MTSIYVQYKQQHNDFIQIGNKTHEECLNLFPTK